jgi:hypothetical protein
MKMVAGTRFGNYLPPPPHAAQLAPVQRRAAALVTGPQPRSLSKNCLCSSHILASVRSSLKGALSGWTPLLPIARFLLVQYFLQCIEVQSG